MEAKEPLEFLKYTENYQAISFDMFDTLVYRKYLGLDEVQLLSAKYLASNIADKSVDIGSLLYLRSHVTNLLKDSISLNTQEPTLAQIFERILCGHGLHGKELDLAVNSSVDFEFKLERSNLEVIPGTTELLQELKATGKTIVVISDMYFTCEYIREILAETGLLKFIDDLYVSASIKKTKQTTDLYSHVLDDQKIQPHNIIHIGDNKLNDVKNAEKVAIKAVHFKYQSPRPLSNAANSISKPDITRKIADLSIGFVCKVLLECNRLNIKKVYFLSRDGTVFLEIAEKLYGKNELLHDLIPKLELKELHLSRTTTAFLSLSRTDTLKEILNTFLWLFHNDFTLRMLLKFFSLHIEKSLEIPINNTLTDRRINHQSIDWLYVELSKERYLTVVELIINAAKKHAETTIDYLIQEGAIGSGKVAIIDLGYTSTSLRQISTYLHKEADKTVRANTEIHKFLLIEGPQRRSNFDLSSPYLKYYHPSTIAYEVMPIRLRGNFSWLECFFADKRRGPLVGYKKGKNGNLTGDFYSAEIDSQQPSEIAAYLDHVNMKGKGGLMVLSNRYMEKIVGETLQELSNPCIATVEHIQKLTQALSPMEVDNVSIVNSNMGLKDLLPSQYKQNIRNEIWYAGSLVASNKRYLIPVTSLLRVGYTFINRNYQLARKVYHRFR